jgi:hypothetical protein
MNAPIFVQVNEPKRGLDFVVVEGRVSGSLRLVGCRHHRRRRVVVYGGGRQVFEVFEALLLVERIDSRLVERVPYSTWTLELQLAPSPIGKNKDTVQG